MGVRHCAVYGCKSSSLENLSVHMYPKLNTSTRVEWVSFLAKASPRKKLRLSKGYGICSKHFERNSFQNLKQFLMGYSVVLHLHKGACPTIVDGEMNEIFWNRPAYCKRKKWTRTKLSDILLKANPLKSNGPDVGGPGPSGWSAENVEHGDSCNDEQSSLNSTTTDDSVAAANDCPLSDNEVNQSTDRADEFYLYDEKSHSASELEKSEVIQKTRKRRRRKPSKHQLKRVRQDCISIEPQAPQEDLEDTPLLQIKSENEFDSVLMNHVDDDTSSSSPDSLTDISSFLSAQLPLEIPEIREEPYIKEEPQFAFDTEDDMPFPDAAASMQPTMSEKDKSPKVGKHNEDNPRKLSESGTTAGDNPSNKESALVKQEPDDTQYFPMQDIDADVEHEPRIINVRTVKNDYNTVPMAACDLKKKSDRAKTKQVSHNEVLTGDSPVKASVSDIVQDAGSGYHSKVFEMMYKMQNSGKFCDLTLCITPKNCAAGSTVHGVKVHKSVFASVSKKLAKWEKEFFFLDAAHTLESLHSLVQFVYTGRIDNIGRFSYEKVVCVWRSALVLEIPICIAYIMSQRPDVARASMGSRQNKHSRLLRSFQNWLQMQCKK